MLDTPCSEVVWSVLATHSTRMFPLNFPYLRPHVPSGFNSAVPPRTAEEKTKRAYICYQVGKPRVKDETGWKWVAGYIIQSLLGYVGPQSRFGGREKIVSTYALIRIPDLWSQTIYMTDNFLASYLNRRPLSCLGLQTQPHLFRAPVEFAVCQTVFM